MNSRNQGLLGTILESCLLYCQTFFQTAALFHIPTSNILELFSPHTHQYTLLSVFLMMALLEDMKWYLIMILIRISLITNYVEHLFICLLFIHVTSLVKCHFKSFPHFLIGLFVLLSCKIFSQESHFWYHI